jgi:hypothetical protein
LTLLPAETEERPVDGEVPHAEAVERCDLPAAEATAVRGHELRQGLVRHPRGDRRVPGRSLATRSHVVVDIDAAVVEVGEEDGQLK